MAVILKCSMQYFKNIVKPLKLELKVNEVYLMELFKIHCGGAQSLFFPPANSESFVILQILMVLTVYMIDVK